MMKHRLAHNPSVVATGQSGLLSQVFNWLRFPMMVLVVLIHVVAPDAAAHSALPGIACYDVLYRALSVVLAQVAVPMFFFMSGYLFFSGLRDWDWHVYWTKLKKRSRSLLLPYLLWNTVALLLLIVLITWHDGWIMAKNHVMRFPLWKYYWCSRWWISPPDWLGVTHRMTAPCLLPLWFLRDLMVVMVLSPVLWGVLRYLKCWGVVVLLLAYLSQAVPAVPGWSWASLFFFGAGAYMNMAQVDPVQWAINWRRVVYPVALVLWIGIVALDGTVVHGIHLDKLLGPWFVIAGMLAMINVAATAVGHGHRFADVLTSGSFFIFLAHPFFLEISYRLSINLLGAASVFSLMARYLLSAILSIGICVLLYWLLRKFVPPLCSLLTGR